MEWNFLTLIPPQQRLWLRCSFEADWADRVAQGLDALRITLNPSFHGHMAGVTGEIRQTSKLLRDLAARSHGHPIRTPIVAEHLSIILPCMSKTLRDITLHCENKTVSREIRWKKLYHDTLKEAGGMPLTQRFLLYNHFLTLLIYFLTRDQRFDPTWLNQLRSVLLDLRREQAIPDPVQAIEPATVVVTSIAPDAAPPAAAPALADQLVQQRPPVDVVAMATPPLHWCSRVFIRPPSYRTETGFDERLETLAPTVSWLDTHQPRGRVVMRRSFDNDRFCVKFVIVGDEEVPFVVLRTFKNGGPLVTWKAHNELYASRKGNVVMLRTQSGSRRGWSEWAKLTFKYWEELVLFYTAFVVLKARNPTATGTDPREYRLADEAMLFQATIVDDGYKHTLMVNQDQRNGCIRLLAAVADGELKKCPVWIAFVPHRLLSSRQWLVRDSTHLVLVKNIRLYVFCQNYREARMRRRRSGLFEIYFVGEGAAQWFVEVLGNLQRTLDPPEEQERLAGPSSSQ